MLLFTSVLGNIFHDKQYGSLAKSDYERLRIPRQDLEKTRIRKKTDRGTDVGLALERGKTLCHGDVLSGYGRTIVVEQTPEKVILARLNGCSTYHLVLLGHIIGNRHRPISMHDGVVAFPAQSHSELEIFERLFSGIDGIELSAADTVFTTHSGANVHGHG